VIAATNRADILDPALMRSGRLDRKIEFPHPSEEARARILQVWPVVSTCSKTVSVSDSKKSQSVLPLPKLTLFCVMFCRFTRGR